MTKIKRTNNNGWKPVTLEGTLLSSSIEGLIGIEELTDYNLERSSKKGKIVITEVKSTEKKKVSIYLLFIFISWAFPKNYILYYSLRQSADVR